jgi:WD40 repeat protein
VATGQERAALEGHTNSVIAVSFSNNGKTLASGCQGGKIKLWEVATGQERAALTGHTGHVLSVSFSGDDKTLASGSQDGTIKLWDVAFLRRWWQR